ncbi:MAG: glycosyltransferase [Thermodesulfobacteriota bacterium]|nr:glycosyltransferase [Thermodesulfobacteriota bacterium]
MKKIFHIISSLSTGGAEMMLYKLLSRMDSAVFVPEVVSLTDIGSVGRRILDLEVRVRCLGMSRGSLSPTKLFKLVQWLRIGRPGLIQTWMYHADLIGSIATFGAGHIPVVWNIRQTNLSPEFNKRSTIRTAGLCARFSHRLPSRIICNSHVSCAAHVDFGYDKNKMIVIPNGFDLDFFKPDPAMRNSVRKELGLPDHALLIGLVARFDPQKDHHNFIRAASILSDVRPDVHFVLCGKHITKENSLLAGWISNKGLNNKCSLLGERHDIPKINSALDIACSASIGEGFPNVVGEAMACGVPCAVTDVGDSALIVGDTGRVAPAEDHRALASALAELVDMGPEERARLGKRARSRIEEHFSLSAVAAKYESLYQELAF